MDDLPAGKKNRKWDLFSSFIASSKQQGDFCSEVYSEVETQIQGWNI